MLYNLRVLSEGNVSVATNIHCQLSVLISKTANTSVLMTNALTVVATGETACTELETQVGLFAINTSGVIRKDIQQETICCTRIMHAMETKSHVAYLLCNFYTLTYY